jgi:GTP-binding protein
LRHTTVSFAGSAASAAQLPKDGLPEVAFLGRSNVGKSSLLNALSGVRGLARVSSQPGRTQTLNFFRVAGGAGPSLYFVDLPGYGYARVPEAMRRSWDKLVRGYLLKRERLALCVFLLDARHEPMEGDVTLRAFLEETNLPFAIAATKTDKLGRGEQNKRLQKLRSGFGATATAVVGVSAATGHGLPELWRVIREATEPSSLHKPTPPSPLHLPPAEAPSSRT